MWRVSWLTDWVTDWRTSLWKVWVVRNFPAATRAFMKISRSETPSQYRPLYTFTSPKFSSFCWTPFSASVTQRTYVQFCDIIADLCKQTDAGTCTAPTVETNWFRHMFTRTVTTCNFSVVSPTLPAPKAGDFVELLPLYVWIGVAQLFRCSDNTKIQPSPKCTN